MIALHITVEQSFDPVRVPLLLSFVSIHNIGALVELLRLLYFLEVLLLSVRRCLILVLYYLFLNVGPTELILKLLHIPLGLCIHTLTQRMCRLLFLGMCRHWILQDNL